MRDELRSWRWWLRGHLCWLLGHVPIDTDPAWARVLGTRICCYCYTEQDEVA